MADFDFEDEDEVAEVVESPKSFLSGYINVRGYTALKANPQDIGGKLRLAMVNAVATEDAKQGAAFIIASMPPGKFRFMGALSHLDFNFGATFNCGWYAHKIAFMGKVPTKLNGLDADVVVKKGTAVCIGSAVDNMTTSFDSMEGVSLVITCKKGVKKGDRISGYIVYVQT